MKSITPFADRSQFRSTLRRTFMTHWKLSGVALAASLLAGAAHAGPFILSGTDADDHGSATATANEEGWLFMQKALENIAPGVTNGNKTVISLGSSAGEALNAATSAFNLSSLPGLGWSFVSIPDLSTISATFATSIAA
ncbi:MAG: hypothetical protein ABIP61_11730, partial [Burkholderiaceae bacterium]